MRGMTGGDREATLPPRYVKLLVVQLKVDAQSSEVFFSQGVAYLLTGFFYLAPHLPRPVRCTLPYEEGFNIFP